MGAVIVLRPDLIDYETDPQFDLVIVAYDLVMPLNQRRQVNHIVRVTLMYDFDDVSNIPMTIGNYSLYCGCERCE